MIKSIKLKELKLEEAWARKVSKWILMKQEEDKYRNFNKIYGKKQLNES